MVEVNLLRPTAMLYRGPKATVVVWLVSWPALTTIRSHRDGRISRTITVTPFDWMRFIRYADGEY